MKRTLPNEIDLSTTGLIENERVLAKDWSRFTFKLYIARSVYGSKDSMQHLIVFEIKIPRIKSEKNFTFHLIGELGGILAFNEITNSFIKSYRIVFIRLIGIEFTLASLQ
jgi:hypothetical protein